MYTLLRTVPVRRLLLEQAPTLTASFVIAELLYKFQSFTLETGAFLVTWLVLDAAVQAVRRAAAAASARRLQHEG